jgi:hypothetical protein
MNKMKYYKLTFLDAAFKKHTISFYNLEDYTNFRTLIYQMGYEIIKKEEFEMRAYGFGELAQLYLPDATPMSASNRLRIWIKRNNTLTDKLDKLGYVKKARLLTPEMVKEIVAVIGEP